MWDTSIIFHEKVYLTIYIYWIRVYSKIFLELTGYVFTVEYS